MRFAAAHDGARAVFPDPRAFLTAGEAKVMRFAAAHDAARAVFPDPRGFLNLNTPEDLATAETLLKGTA